MKEANLPSPGVGQRGFHLRRLMAQIISDLQIREDKTDNGVAPAAADLLAFMNACNAAIATTGKAKPVLTLTPANSTGAVASTQQLTLGKGGSSGAATYTSSNPAVATVNASGLVTRVATGTAVITASVAEGTAHKAASITASVTVS